MYIKQAFSFRGSNAITGFSKMIGGPNYSPFIRTHEFIFSGDTLFSFENLQQVLHHRSLVGAVQPSSEQQVNEVLANAFGWKVNGEGVIAQSNNEALTKARVFFFWDCLQEEFGAPIEHFFMYMPEQGCYFKETTVWSFCFVIISGNKGLVVSGKTWKNDEDCPFESHDEEQLRNVFGMV